jgi:hypothetical protein
MKTNVFWLVSFCVLFPSLSLTQSPEPFPTKNLWSNFKADVLWDAWYHVSSRTNQFIASSRVLNLGNSRREKVLRAS